jgi:hypothetical protein
LVGVVLLEMTLQIIPPSKLVAANIALEVVVRMGTYKMAA